MFIINAKQIVTKTYTKEGGATREQNYDGIKFRRVENKEGKISETFHSSNKFWDKLGLDGDDDALAQYVTEDGNVLLLHTDNETGTMFKSTKRNEGDKKKSRHSKNSILAAALVEAGVLEADKLGNQFLTLTEEEFEAADGIKGVYSISLDSSVEDTDDEDDDQDDL